jgi:hypothetical protein
MAHHMVTSADIPVDGEHIATDKVAKLRKLCLPVMAGGMVISYPVLIFGIGVSDAAQGSYIFSWLYAFFFFLTLCLGGCFWTLLHNVSNSGWGTSVRRVMENVGFVFPFMIVFAVPFLFPSVQRYLWDWMEMHRLAGGGLFKSARDGLHHGEHADHLLSVKYWYLNITFWYVRFFALFALLGFIIYRLRKWSIEQDTDPKPGTARLFRSRRAAAWGIPCFAVVLTFLAIDLVKGLDYKWFSTMFGVYVFAGSALNSMAVIIVVTILLRRQGYLHNVVGPEHDHLMGKLAFTFTVFWAYITFSQFFLIWYANITEETRYFLLRNTENWNIVSLLLLFGHFAAPFLLLIRQDLKRKNSYMIVVACYLLFMHMIDVYHMVIPERGPSVGMAVDGNPRLWLGGSFFGDLIAFVIVGAGFVFFLLRNIASAALYPHRDPRILESANVHN